MRPLLLIAALLLAPAAVAAQDHVYPAHSWTYNVDFKDPEALAPFVGREVVDGQWKAGARFDPLSIYRIDDEKGEATRWLRGGVMYVSNAEKLNATFGPHLGIDLFQFASKTALAGALKSFWKPLGFASVSASIDIWGGWTPLHTADVYHNYAGGFGFSLVGLFGNHREAADAANAIIKGGL